jgi:lysozyme
MNTSTIVDLDHQNLLPPDFFSKVAGVIHKASQGSTFKDPEFAHRRMLCEAAGIPFACYHFGDNSPVPDQVANFLAALDASGDRSVHVQLDWEDLEGREGNDISMSEDQARQFCVLIYQATGRYPEYIYGSDQITESEAAKTFDPVLSQSALWLAQPVEGSGPLPADFQMPAIQLASWPKIALLQYSNDPPPVCHEPDFAPEFQGADWNFADVEELKAWG